MSSDDGYIVSPLYLLPGKFGIFHYTSDDDKHAPYYIKDNTVDKTEYDSAVTAIVSAHSINSTSFTEYGVYVHTLAINAAIHELAREKVERS